MSKMAVTYPPGNLAVLGDIPAIGTKFQTAGQTGLQTTTLLVTAPYPGTVYLRSISERSPGKASLQWGVLKPPLRAMDTGFTSPAFFMMSRRPETDPGIMTSRPKFRCFTACLAATASVFAGDSPYSSSSGTTIACQRRIIERFIFPCFGGRIQPKELAIA